MKRYLIALTAIVCIAALAAFTVVLSDGSDADTVETPVITFYTPESESYSAMAYREDALPDGMSATRYVRNADGYWYDIDYGGASNGSYLTYGDLVPRMSVQEIRADLETRYGADFLVMQVSFKINEACNVSYKIEKDSVAYVPTSVSASLAVNGIDCHSVRYVKQFAVGTDFVPADEIGTYTLSVKCDGTSIGTDSVTYSGSALSVTGYVKDKSGRGIRDAVVYFTRSEGNTEVAITDSSGLYTIAAYRGESIKITSASRSDYNFSFTPINSGDLTGDYVFADIVSKERTVLVHVTDLSGTYPLEDVDVLAQWYIETDDPAAPPAERYSLTKSDMDIITSHTDSDGNVLIICRDPMLLEHQRCALFVYAQSPQYTFELDGDFATPSATPFNFLCRSQPGSALVCNGDDFADFSSPLTHIDLSCEDSCIEVTVRGNVDAHSIGGAPIRDVHVTAEWYYQVERGTGYEYSTSPQTEFTMSVQGTAFPVTSVTDENGRIVIAYIIPQWTPNGIAPEKLKAYLYIHYTGTNPLYEFDVMSTVPPGGTSSFPDIVAEHAGSDALDSTAVANTEIRSSDVAYLVSGTITGPVPSNVVLNYNIYQNVGSLYNNNATVDTSVSPATFHYTVKAGLFSKITIASIDGYSFSPSPVTMATMTNNADVNIVCSVVPPTPYARSVPVILETYTINGLSAGDVIRLTVNVGGTSIVMQRTSAGASLDYPVYGHSENRITALSISSDSKLFVPEFAGNTVTVAKIVPIQIVTFADGTTSTPAIANITPSATIRATYAGGTTEVKTSANGTASFEAPQGYDVTYVFISGSEQYSVTGTIVADGPFAGRVALNLHGVVDVDTDVIIKLTEQRVSYSSLFNTSPAESTVLSSETMDRVVGQTVKFSAPEISGFEFSGWYLGNTCVSDKTDMELTISEDLDGKKLSAVYAALPEEIPDEGIEPTTLMIGLVAIMIAIMCFAYVILQNKRY